MSIFICLPALLKQLPRWHSGEFHYTTLEHRDFQEAWHLFQLLDITGRKKHQAV